MWCMNFKSKKKLLNFKTNFVHKEAKKANDTIYGKEVMNPSSTAPKRENEKVNTFSRSSRKFATKTMESNSSTENHTATARYKPTFCAFVKPCIYCQGSSHSLEECKNIMKLPLKDRYAVLKVRGLCFSCLKSGHQKGVCQRKSYCIHCTRCHPSILHMDPSQSFETADQNITDYLYLKHLCLRQRIWGPGNLWGNASNYTSATEIKKHRQIHLYYAFFDSGSTATFRTEKIANLLHIEGKKTLFNLTTIGQQKTENCYILSGLEITDLNGDNPIDLSSI